MKELTIKQKAKAYDEAIKVARLKIKNDKDHVLYEEDITDIFPVLKESKEIDDERIRRVIRGWIYTRPASFFDNGISKEEALAWLEKQGEQKSVNKVEPKFNVGDWVVSPNGVYWHIDAINNNRYEVSSTDGVCADWPLDTDLYHLWTIQDAKDGDVLVASDDSIFIYNGDITKSGSANFYVACTRDNYITFGGDVECGWENKDSCLPATKEQCDTLINAMADAGYAFDFEKKESKKIEQKPAENKGMNLVEEEMTPFQKKVFCIIDTTIEEEQGLKQVCDELLRLAHEEQKPAWSEKDKTYSDHVITAIKLYYTDYKGKENPWREELLMWFKSLKDRVQPKQEWSEDDNAMLISIENILIGRGHSFHDKEINWLKSLRPQNTWKPSDLPHWKKSTLPNDNTTGFNSDYFCHKGYNINYKELFEKLPKDD